MISKMSETSNALNGYSNQTNIQNNTNIGNKRFLLLSEESVKSIADQNGFDNLSEEAIRLLSSDVSFRVRHLIHNSSQLMRQSKRRRLTAKDVNQALETSDCEKVFGFEARDDPIQESYVREAKVFVAEDPIIDLNEEINKIFERIDCQMNLFDEEFQIKIDLDSVKEKDDSYEEDFLNSEDCCEELKHFYQNLVKAILGTNNNTFSMAIKDLSNNRRISKVLPYLINFIINGIRRLSHDISQLKRFLQTIQCLLRNPSLHLSTDPFQSVLVQSILECIIEPLNPMSDHWTLRDSASHLLANVLNEWFNPLEGRILNQTYDSLRNCLLDFSKPFSSHYGVIKAFQSLGYDIIVEHLYPILSIYFDYLLPAIDPNNHSSDPQTRIDGLRVFGELLFVSELICLKTRSLIINDSDIVLDHKDYNQLSKIFGDSLYSRLPISFQKIRSKFYSEKYKNRCERQISLFETIDTQKTGEDLLDAFYEAPTHSEDIKSEMSPNLEDDNSCEDNSVVSDNERETTATDLLQIKSTISDPTLGIKLTFKKLKREHNTSDTDPKRSRNNRKSHSLISEPVFELICLKESSIRFDYGLNLGLIFN